jgi:hypothetical protein
MTTTMTTDPLLATLARQEIRTYLRSKVFRLGAVALLALCVAELAGRSDGGGASTSGDGLLPAAAVGLLGISVMATLVRRSDQAAAAAGSVGVSVRTRTLALAAATVVPASAGLVWFGCAVTGYLLYPPAPNTVPFPGFGDGQVIATMFAQGVMSCVGGPILGLVIGRWLPNRAAAPLISVVLVPITMVFQPLFDVAERWHVLWIWTHFAAPFGVPGDPERYVASPGSVWAHIAYLAALCVLGVLVALYRDPDADHSRLRRRIAAACTVVAVLGLLTVLAGPDDWVVNPLPSPAASADGVG